MSNEIETALAAAEAAPGNSLVFAADTYVASRGVEIVAPLRGFAITGDLSQLQSHSKWQPIASISPALEAGGLLCGPHLQGRQAGRSAGAVANEFELVVNLKDRKGAGASVPPSVLARTDEIIE
jgi:hypothetical protein